MLQQKFAHIPRFSAEPCPGCPLGAARKVGGRGREDAELVIIGESPGGEELRHGVPFVGPSGNLLWKSCPEGFNPDTDAFVINSMQCKPPKTKSPVKDKAFKEKACAQCRTRVLEQVFRHPRRCVLALGGWSSTALTADYGFKVTQRRGEVYKIKSVVESDLIEEIPVVPAVHPAFLLRGSGNPQVFREDVALAMHIAFPERFEHPRPDVWVDPKYTILETLPQIREYEKYLRQTIIEQGGSLDLAGDIETSGFSPFEDYILCIGFYQKDKDDIAFIIPGESLKTDVAKAALRRVLTMPGLRIIWQFGKFDQKFLWVNRIVDGLKTNIIHEDIGLLSYAMSEASKDHDLDEQAKNDLGAPNHKHMLKQWAPKKSDSYAKVPRPVLYDYLAKDLKKTRLVYDVKRPLVRKDPHLEKLYTKTLLPISRLLAEIELVGIHVDWDYVRINREGATDEDVERGLVESKEGEIGLEQELVDLETKLHEIAGWNVNPNAPEQVKELLYTQLNLKIKGVVPQDTEKETLEKLPQHPAVKLIRDYRSRTKMLGTYCKAIEDRAIEDRIHTTFKLHATTTGRLSSSEPNIQNIPREPRWKRMYRARPGYILIEGDYNAAELRMLAALSGDKFLTGVFLDDKRNLHDEVSIAMYGPNFNAYQRIRAKAINFGIPYGREAYSVATEFDMPEGEAQRLIDAWFARAPEAAAFLKIQRSAPAQGRTLITVFGRKRRPGVVSAERLKGLMNEFANFHMQSPINDFTLQSALRIQPQLRKLGGSLVNLIHDSALAEVPDNLEVIAETQRILKTVMEHVPTLWIQTPITFKVDIKQGSHWGLLKDPDKIRKTEAA